LADQDPPATAVVAMTGITKSFAGTTALKGVDFDIRRGEVHALLGENGAGKSTLIKILSGLYGADAGVIHVDGRETSFASARDTARAGIATVYQELLLFPELSVAENVFLGHYPRFGWGGIDWGKTRELTRELLDRLDSPELDVDAKVSALSVAQRQRIEIAKALSQNARILIMDEPTASLAEADVKRLMSIVRRLRERGVGIVYVSHRLPEIFALADRVTVLRDGALIATRPIGEVDEAGLVAMMVGRSIEQLFPKSEVEIGEVVLRVEGLQRGNRVRDVSFALRRGEILGIAGLVGSGRTELALTLFGITPATSGTIELNGKAVRITSPRQARDLGLGYVPEDRGLQGLIKTMTIAQNVTMASIDRLSWGIFIRFRRELAEGVKAVKRLGIRARGVEQKAGQLSGGNQQKVVVAKWLETEPKVLILDEPTRGVDVGAKAEIHAIMGELVKRGLAIVMISSELPEVLGMSDRVLVISNGRVVREFGRADATPESVGAAMTAAAGEAEAA
jgi:ABC-type sugar transport system ATPase subunit